MSEGSTSLQALVFWFLVVLGAVEALFIAGFAMFAALAPAMALNAVPAAFLLWLCWRSVRVRRAEPENASSALKFLAVGVIGVGLLWFGGCAMVLSDFSIH